MWPGQADGVRIFIGGESQVPPFEDLSIVSAPYEVDGEVVGTLGVIGPTRMPYDRMIQIVDITAKLVSNALSHPGQGSYNPSGDCRGVSSVGQSRGPITFGRWFKSNTPHHSEIKRFHPVLRGQCAGDFAFRWCSAPPGACPPPGWRIAVCSGAGVAQHSADRVQVHPGIDHGAGALCRRVWNVTPSMPASRAARVNAWLHVQVVT